MAGTVRMLPSLRDAAWLGRALDDDRLVVHYQPVVTLPDRRILGVEALARVLDTDGTLLYPASFLPLAHDVEMLRRLDWAVLEQALDAVCQWRRRPELSQLYVAVNVAPSDLEDRSLPDRIALALRKRNLPASALLIEVVESDLIASTATTYETVEALAALGLRIALDDFGTGFATLENLHRLPVSMIKIDRMFVAGLGHENTDEAIVRAVIDLADALDITVVAEGVETEHQAQRLVAIGCPAAQGWLFATPQTAASLDLALAHVPTAGFPAATLLRWTVEQRAGAVACARVLSMSDPDGGQRRALAYAVATSLSAELELTRGAAEDTGLLTLLADADRLLPASSHQARMLDRLPGVRGLLERDRLADPLLQVRLAAVAAGIAERVHDRDEIAAVAAAAADQLDDDDPLVAGLRRLRSDTLGDVAANVDRLLDTLTARTAGRGALEGRIRGLAALAQGMASVGSYREVLALAAEEARRTLGSASLTIGRYDMELDTVTALCNVGHLGPGEVRFPDAEVYLLSDFPVAGRLYHAGLPHIQSVDDEAGDPGERQLLLQYGKGSCASVPIKVADVLWGELYATTQLGAPVFSSRDIELLTACAAFVGAAVMHAERLEQIGRLAFEDPLTSLANRRAVDDALAAALDASGAGAALVVVDVNAFKGVNDRFGHTVGDQVLRAVGAALAAAAAPYPGATVGRVGGDEFCVVLPAISEHAAVAIVEEASSRLAEEPPPRIRIAGGVALGVAGSRPQELFMAADAAQYAAKREHLVVVTDRASRRRSASGDVVRRAHRNGHQVDWLAVLQACTDALALQDAGSPVGDRLQVVAEVVSECLGLGRWALSYAGPDGVLRLRRLRVYRQRPAGAGGRDLAEDSGVYRLADFPLTAAVVRDGGSFYVDARDPNADAAERRWLAGFGLRALLGVGVPDGDGGWLLELLAEENEALEELAPLVDLVAQLCRR